MAAPRSLRSVLRGRVRERAAVDALLDRARAGTGGGLLLHGEPGIGKSALLAYAAERADGMRVLRTAGVEPEADLGYATLHRLMFSVLGSLDRLPEPQARALGVVFGRAEGTAPDRFLVALAVLSLLSETAGERPLLCLVDDAQWADPLSMDVLAFVARRLDTEPIALAMAARADEGRAIDVAGLVDVPLAGLDRESAGALLAEHGGERLSPAERDELLVATGGNPLAIRELPAVPRSLAAQGEPAPLAAGMQQAFLDRARRRDPGAQRLLLLVAADGSGRVDAIRRAAKTYDGGDTPVPMQPLETGALDDLLVADGATLAFRHPLIRSAIYHGASQAERRSAHRALATAFEADPAEADRRAWHLGQASDGPDDAAADELERSAERAMRRGGPAAAAAALERAAALSGSDDARARRWVAAARAWWRGGHATSAHALLDRAERMPSLAAAERLDLRALQTLMDLRAGSPADALARLLPVLPDLVGAESGQAVELLMLFGEAGFHANAGTAWDEITVLAERLPANTGGDTDLLIRLFRGACRSRAGRDHDFGPDDVAALERLTDPTTMAWAGGMAYGIGLRDLALRMRRTAADRARASGAAGTLAWILEYVVGDEISAGRFATAEAHAEEAYRFAVESGQPSTACRHQSSLALLAALRGDEERARELADEVLAEANDRDLRSTAAVAYRTLGLLDLATGRATEALAHFEAIGRDRTAVHPGLVLITVPELVEAAVRDGRPERAQAPYERFATWADATGAPDLLALAARCGALLASGTAAEEAYVRALELHTGTGSPLERARTELLYGQHLRRERRRTDARTHLRAAQDTFRRIGAAVWADRAGDELRATGETARQREPSTLTTLTPQELRIATVVSEGATNREIAAQLFLSPRTVDYHLRKVFQKLGVTSRTELTRLVLAEAAGQPG
ncbi:MAG: AAA family ATPase [Streptosporangiales bacterium]|nr:AAA family ATPase [Streptosporangiales bacterium]